MSVAAFTAWKNLATGHSVKQARVAALDATTGKLVTDFNPVVDLPVRAITVSAGGAEIFLGGDVSVVNTAPNTRLAAVDPRLDTEPRVDQTAGSNLGQLAP